MPEWPLIHIIFIPGLGDHVEFFPRPLNVGGNAGDIRQLIIICRISHKKLS